MTFSILRTSLAGALLGAVLTSGTTPALALAQPAHTVAFQTRLTKAASAGEIDGTLRLSFSSAGIVNGTYREADGGRPVPVTGGLDGKNIWLDIGAFDSAHLSGTYQDGKIVATELVPSDFHPGIETATFEAEPTPAR